jgi:hypothetical protein
MHYIGASDADDRLFGFSCSFPFTNAVSPVVSIFRLYGMHRLYVNMAWANQFHDNVFLRINFIAFSPRDRLWRRDLGANGKIQKEREQTEAQPDGA